MVRKWQDRTATAVEAIFIFSLPVGGELLASGKITSRGNCSFIGRKSAAVIGDYGFQVIDSNVR